MTDSDPLAKDEVVRKRQAEAAARWRERQSQERREARLAYNRVYSAKWRAAHPDAGKVYEETHREEIAAKRKVWRDAHKAERAASHRRYYEAHGEEIRAHHRARYAANPEPFKQYGKTYRAARGEPFRQQARASGLRLNYGMTLADYDAMLESQGGLCGICTRPASSARLRSFHVDHDHVSGCVRGLLCPGCNRAIGHFRDDPAILVAAIAYLTR